MWLWLFSISIWVVFLEINTKSVNDDIQNVQVTRTIDITSFIAKDKYKITFRNVGSNPVNKYAFELQDDLAYATFRNYQNEKLHYSIEKNINSTTYNIKLEELLYPDEDYKLQIHLMYPDKFLPGTKYSRYNETATFIWKGNHAFYSRYLTQKYKYLFIMDPSFNIDLELSRPFEFSTQNTFIYFLNNIKPYTNKDVVARFSTSLLKFRVKDLQRRIYVSQFGKITVQDEVIVENACAKFQGPHNNTLPVYWMFTHLPSSAEQIKLYDIIGTNSRYSVHEKDGRLTIKFVPRYPLLRGGWKSSYILEYLVPIYEYVFRDECDFVLKIRAIDHILNDVMIENVDVKIVLPDGASVVSVLVPSGFKRENDSKTFTALSIFGRKTLSLKGSHLLEDHINDVEIKYHFSVYHFLLVPAYVIFLFESMFLFIMIWKRRPKKFLNFK